MASRSTSDAPAPATADADKCKCGHGTVAAYHAAGCPSFGIYAGRTVKDSLQVAPATAGPVLTERVPCPAVWDCYADGAMRCCREDGHEGWHRPSVFVWEGILDIAAMAEKARADAAEARVAALETALRCAPHGLNDSFVRCKYDVPPHICDCWKRAALEARDER